MKKLTLSVTPVFVIAALVGLKASTQVNGNARFSARSEPSHMEAMMAEYARNTAMPAFAKAVKNPIVLTTAAKHEAMAHFADHCAVCHTNNGSGQSCLERNVSHATRP